MAIEILKPLHNGVHLAYCHNGSVRAAWAECYSQLLIHDAATRHLIKSKGMVRGLYVPGNRNLLTRLMLRDTKCEWLFFLDVDMLFEPKQFHDLYDAAVENKCDILGGLYYGYQGDGCIYPTWLEMHKDGLQQQTASTRTVAIQDLATIGMGFTLIHRRVLEALGDAMPNHNWAWFGHDEAQLVTGETDCIGEDTTFCARARKLGFKVQGDSRICLGHEKFTVLTWESFDVDQARRHALEAQEKLKESA